MLFFSRFIFAFFMCMDWLLSLQLLNAEPLLEVMDRALAQLTYLPLLNHFSRHGQIKGYGKTIRTVRMVCNVQFSPLRMASFSGLQGSNAFGTMVRPGLDFRSTLAPAISNRQRKSRRFVPKAMFERFTEKAIKVIMLAQEETKRLGHNNVGTEQLLLGLIGEGTGIAAKVLKSMGINLKDARIEMEKIIGRGSGIGIVSGEIPCTPLAKRVLELSLEEASKLGKSLDFFSWLENYSQCAVVFELLSKNY